MSKESAAPTAFVLPSATNRETSRLGWLSADGTLRKSRAALPFPSYRVDAARGHAVSADWVVGLRPAAILSSQSSFLYRARLRWNRGRPLLEPLPEITVSAWQQVNALLLDGHWLYVGGSWARDYLWQHEPAEPRPDTVECFVRYNLSEADPQPEPIPLPVDFGPGKAIDDLLRCGPELLVVDNVVFPKYLFFYQLRPTPLLPQWQRTHQLPFRRTYEKIRGGEWNSEFIALLSSSVGMGGSGHYVSVLRRPDLKPVLLLATYYLRLPDSSQRRSQGWTQLEGIALQGDTLLVTCGKRGLARIRLSATTAWPRKRTYFTTYEWQRDANGKKQMGEARRSSERRLADAQDLATADAADGVEWLPLPPGWLAVSTVRFVGPGQALIGHRQRTALLQLP